MYNGTTLSENPLNIFVLSHDPVEAARQQADKHVVKMVLETAQLLCTAHRVIDGVDDSILYKQTHANHPCAIWVRESRSNYDWLYAHFEALANEYTFRYGKAHATWKKLATALKTAPKLISAINQTPFALCMPDEYKVNDDPVLSYQAYYIQGKASILNWTRREVPEFIRSHNAIV